MITNITLTGWKAFDQLTLDLPQGTSFIVARNGVGKTSLLQAIHFGLFGDRHLLGSGSPVERAVRGGEDHIATVAIVVILGDRTWRIERTVPGSMRRTDVLPTAEVSVDGNPASSSDWEVALADIAGVSLTELRLLAAIGEGATLAPPELQTTGRYNLIEHLSEVLGVSRLRDAASELGRAAKTASTNADQERLSLRVRPERIAAGQLDQLRTEETALAERQAELTNRIQQEGLLLERIMQWRTWRAQDAAARREVSAAIQVISSTLRDQARVLHSIVPLVVVDELSQATAGTEEPGDQFTQLSAAQTACRRIMERLHQLRDETLRLIGGYQARQAAIDDALQLLDQAEAICPTCRQPLSEDAANRARVDHRSEQADIGRQMSEARRRAEIISGAVDALRRVNNMGVPRRVVQPPGSEPTEDSEEVEGIIHSIESELSGVTDRRNEVGFTIRRIEQEAKQRAEDAALEQRLVAQYRRSDLAAAAAEAFITVADDICRERINPLADVLTKKMAELWPDRPVVRLDPGTGNVYGRASEVDISLADLSGGERAVVIILLRLLALQSASNSPILLMDEPLEHLDPRNRRLLASLLVAATSADDDTPPRQLLVTTYEESVTRRLDASVGESNAHVVYVSPTILPNSDSDLNA